MTLFRKTSRWLSGLVALCTIGLATIALAPAAYAQKVDDIQIHGAEAVFYPTGEYLYLYDTAPDGHPVIVYFALSHGATAGGSSVGDGYMTDHNGFGTQQSINFSIPESGWIKVRVCTTKGNYDLSCSATHTFSAAG
jgi:hypothetical protein